MKDMIDNPKFFGDKYNLIRITAYVEPTLCNSANHHPHNNLIVPTTMQMVFINHRS